MLALKHDPARVSCYDRLARLLRAGWRGCGHNEAADVTIKEMVAKNPEAGLAYIYRWRYAHEFAPPADAADIRTGLKLAPDDPEVLLSAAIASEQKKDAAAARAHFEKGSKLHPKNAALALGLARLEIPGAPPRSGRGRPAGAFQANPSLELAFELAETLILQDKIDGEDQAADTSPDSETRGWATRSCDTWKPRSFPSGRGGPRRSPGSRRPGPS